MSQKQLRLNTKMKYWTASYVKDLLYRKSSVHIHQLKQSLIMCDCSSWCACLMWQTNGILPCNSWTPALLKKTTLIHSACALARRHCFLLVILSILLATSEILGAWSVREFFCFLFVYLQHLAFLVGHGSACVCRQYCMPI